MAVQVIFLSAQQETLPNTDTTVYQCPTTVDSAQVVFANCTNTTGAGVTLTVNVVENGGSVATSNQYINAGTVAANSSDPLFDITGVILGPGDFISAIAGSASALNLKIGIKQVSS